MFNEGITYWTLPGVKSKSGNLKYRCKERKAEELKSLKTINRLRKDERNVTETKSGLINHVSINVTRRVSL